MEQQQDTVLALDRAGHSSRDIMRPSPLVTQNGHVQHSQCLWGVKQVNLQEAETQRWQKVDAHLLGWLQVLHCHPPWQVNDQTGQAVPCRHGCSPQGHLIGPCPSVLRQHQEVHLDGLHHGNLKRCQKILNRLTHNNARMLIFFLDEKKWDMDKTFNQQML